MAGSGSSVRHQKPWAVQKRSPVSKIGLAEIWNGLADSENIE